MRKNLVTYALAGALGLTGVAGAALVAPAVSYAATGDSTALTERVTSIKEVLTGLVQDGTISQGQADAVATTLAETRGAFGGGGHRGGGPRLLEAAEELGITQEELRAAAEAGTTLGALADEQGVDRDALVDALVAAKQERLEGAVTAGRLTQAEADERLAEVETRATQALAEPVRLGRGGHGHGPGDRRGPAGTDSTPTEAPATASPDA